MFTGLPASVIISFFITLPGLTNPGKAVRICQSEPGVFPCFKPCVFPCFRRIDKSGGAVRICQSEPGVFPCFRFHGSGFANSNRAFFHASAGLTNPGERFGFVNPNRAFLSLGHSGLLSRSFPMPDFGSRTVEKATGSLSVSAMISPFITTSTMTRRLFS